MKDFFCQNDNFVFAVWRCFLHVRTNAIIIGNHWQFSNHRLLSQSFTSQWENHSQWSAVVSLTTWQQCSCQHNCSMIIRTAFNIYSSKYYSNKTVVHSACYNRCLHYLLTVHTTGALGQDIDRCTTYLCIL